MEELGDGVERSCRFHADLMMVKGQGKGEGTRCHDTSILHVYPYMSGPELGFVTCAAPGSD